MTPNGILQIVVYFLVIAAVAKPMGVFMTRVYACERSVVMAATSAGGLP